MKRILVTGGAGFIGSHLVDRLVDMGREVVVLDNFEEQVHQGRKPSYLNKNAHYIEGDVCDIRSLKRALEGVDIIFHFAAKVGVGQSMYEIKDYVHANTFGTSLLWQYIIDSKLDIKKFIVASSMSIYGEGLYKCERCGEVTPYLRTEEQLKSKSWEHYCPTCNSRLTPVPTREDKKLLSTSVYAMTKKDQEELSINLGINYRIPTVALRFFNVYGPRQSLSNPYTGACAIFSSRIKNDKPPLIYEDGLQTRDFIDVRDVVKACLLVMDKEVADYKVFNVGTGRACTILDIAKLLTRMYGKELKPEITNVYRAGDIRHCFADISRIRELGFAPEITLEHGLKELVEWSREEQAIDKTESAVEELEKRKLTL